MASQGNQKKFSETISDFLDFLAEAEKKYNQAYKTVGYEDELKVDIDHDLEFALTKREWNKFSEEAHYNRIRRRENKDVVEELQPVVDFISENKKSIDKLKETLGQVRKQEEYHKNRFYVPRVKDRRTK